MGDGLKNAALAALLTRGPWATTTWEGQRRELTGAQVEAFYRAIPDTAAMCAAVDCEAGSARPFDRAATLLKRAGLIRFNKAIRCWERA